MVLDKAKQEGIKEGRLEGKLEGRLQGLEDGIRMTQISVIRNFLATGDFNISQISNLLNVSVAFVENVKMMKR